MRPPLATPGPFPGQAVPAQEAATPEGVLPDLRPSWVLLGPDHWGGAGAQAASSGSCAGPL